jgi:hypothetical protein
MVDHLREIVFFVHAQKKNLHNFKVVVIISNLHTSLCQNILMCTIKGCNFAELDNTFYVVFWFINGWQF